MSSSLPAAPAPHRPRARLILQSVVVMLAVTACCMFAGLIAGKYPRFIDATATRAHRLSPGTLETLSRLTGPTELVVTINSAAIDPRAAERTHDVLDAFDRASDKLTVTTIDVASASGVEQLDAVWRRVGDRYAPEIAAQHAAIGSAAASAGELAARLERIGGTLAELERTVADADPNAEAVRRFLGNSSGFCRLGAKDINDGVAAARDALKATIGRSPVPAFDTAAGAIRKPLPTISGQLAEVSKTIDNACSAKDTEVSPALRDRLKPLGPELLNARDRLARVEQAIEELPRLRLVNVARALERSTTALVIGPPSPGADGRDLAAVDIDALFPPRTAADNAGTPHLDLRARTEELIGSALASLVNPAPPILVLMHGEDKRFAPEFTLFSQVFQRLHLRGIDIVEWPVWLDKQLPSLAKINPRGDRPVVFATIYTIPDKPQDAARYIALSHAIEQLAGAGKPLLLSVNPSTMPAIGQPDAMFEFLSGKDAGGAEGAAGGGVGLKVDSGLAILHRLGTPANPVVSAETLLTPTDTPHSPIAGAINGLRLRLPWAVPLRPQPNAAATITPLLTLTNDGATWAESQWIEFRSVPLPQRPFIRPQDQPRPDSQRDDAKGPWIIAATIERKVPAQAESQRMVVVGSNGWFLDEIAAAATVVDNRRVPSYPGNAELFEASIYWLARQESAITVSPQAEASPVIPPLSAGTVSAIRWSLIAGLPVLVLFAGALWRLLRG